jgi:predicted TIM-barrel enzyme
METSTRLLAQVKSAAEDVPVFCNTGLTLETAREKLAEADGACVGTAFKAEGKFKNPVDLARVIHIMDIVKQIRKESSAS